MTLSNHEPFDFSQKKEYLSKVDSILKYNTSLKVSKQIVNTNKEAFATIFYVDNSLEKFFKEFEKRPDFQNTIFIISGDHRLIPVPQKDKICRFHVPLMIYSPMLKNPERFKAVSSHLDIAPSVISFLQNNYNVSISDKIAWMGTGLDTHKTFRNQKQLGLMRYKGSFKDFVYKEYFFADNQLFKIKNNMDIVEIEDEKIRKEIADSFSYFKKMNAYLTKKDKIYPEKLLTKEKKKPIVFTDEELKTINELTSGKTPDEIYLIAREKAFAGDRKLARLLSDFVLNSTPDFVDLIILKGRTLAWDGDYLGAEKCLIDAIKKFPYYDDPYLALMDTYIWSEKALKSIETGKKALKNQIKNPEIHYKIAKAHAILGDKKASQKIIDSLLKIYPKNEDFIKLKKSLKE
jgi:tetratricopeptide (TPR) repeat protein